MRRIAILLLLALPAPASATTLADLRAEARTLALDNGTRLRFSTATIDNWLNEAQSIANLEMRLIRKSREFDLSAGTTFYSLPSDFLQLLRVTFKYRALGEPTSEALAGKVGWNWIEAKGQPTSYYINFASRTLIAFYPWPDTSSSTGTIRYEYWAQTTDMVLAADTPFNGITELQPYANALPVAAAVNMVRIDGRMDLVILYDNEWDQWMARIKAEANNRPNYRPGMQPGTPLIRTGP